MDRLTIRSARTEEFHAIRDIAYRTWPAAYGKILSPEQLSYMLDRMYSIDALRKQHEQGHEFLVLWVDGRHAGFASYEHLHAGGTNTRLHKLYVLPEHHGKGFGNALLRAVEQAAKSSGARAVELNVNRFNPAKDFYLRKGYSVRHEQVIPIGNGFVMDDFVMVREL